MSKKYSHLPRNLDKLITDALNAGKVLEAVDAILASQELVGETTTTAYRRIHEVVGTVLDYLTRSTPSTARASLELARAKTIVSYQRARDQISDGIYQVVMRVLDSVASRLNRGDLAEVAERGRAILDALAVLVYEYGR